VVDSCPNAQGHRRLGPAADQPCWPGSSSPDSSSPRLPSSRSWQSRRPCTVSLGPPSLDRRAAAWPAGGTFLLAGADVGAATSSPCLGEEFNNHVPGSSSVGWPSSSRNAASRAPRRSRPHRRGVRFGAWTRRAGCSSSRLQTAMDATEGRPRAGKRAPRARTTMLAETVHVGRLAGLEATHLRKPRRPCAQL